MKWSRINRRLFLSVVGLAMAASSTGAQPAHIVVKGELLPASRLWLYSPVEGKVIEIKDGLKHGSKVAKGQELIRMFSDELRARVEGLRADIVRDQKVVMSGANSLDAEVNLAVAQARIAIDARRSQLRALLERTNAIEQNPGEYRVRAAAAGILLNGGILLDADGREKPLNGLVKPSDPLLRLGDPGQGWEVELRIPQREVGQILAALTGDAKGQLDVDLLLKAPGKTVKGKLGRQALSAQARTIKGSHEPFVLAFVRIGDVDLPARASGTEVTCTFVGIAPAESGAAPRQTGLVVFQPSHSVHVFVEEAGTLGRIHVKEGQAVKKGSVLAEFVSVDLNNREQEVRTTMEVKARLLELLERQIAATRDVKEKARLDTVRSNVKSEGDAARLALTQIQNSADRLTVRAPRDGTALSLPTPDEVGKRWERGMALCSVGDLTKLRVLLPVSAGEMAEIRKAKTRDPVSVTLRGLNGKGPIWTGRIAALPDAPAKEIPAPLSKSGGGGVAAKPCSLAPLATVYLVGIDFDAERSDVILGTLMSVEVQWKKGR